LQARHQTFVSLKRLTSRAVKMFCKNGMPEQYLGRK